MAVPGVELHTGTAHVCRLPDCLQQGRAPLRSRTRLHAKRVADSGYFADADPTAPVYAPLGGVDQVDYTKRGGRYTSDFIWNTKWKDQLDLEESRKKQKVEEDAREASSHAGGLSLRRVADLNSMDVDLSAQLRPRQPRKEGAGPPQNGSLRPRAGASAAASAAAAQQILYRRGQKQAEFEQRPPTQGESRRWQRSGRFAKKVVVATSTAPEEVAAAAARAQAEREEYDALKQGLWRWSLATTVACFGVTYAFYSRDTAASYGVGALGGLMYLRLLNRSVDGFGSGLLGAAGGGARFVIPVALALGYNRWNMLAQGHTDIQLQLLPMLLGFFTYKAAVIGKQFSELMAQAARPAPAPGSSSAAEPPADAGVPAGDAVHYVE